MKNIWDAAYGAYFAACVHQKREVERKDLADRDLDAIAEDAAFFAFSAVKRAKAARAISTKYFKKK